MITNMLGIYAIFEELYLRKPTKASGILQKAIIKLYATILTFLAEAKHYYTQKTGIRIVKSVLKISQRDMAKLCDQLQDDRVAVDEIARLIDAEYLRTTSEDIQAASSDAQKHNDEMRKALSKLERPIQRFNDQLDILVKHLEREKKLEILNWISKI